MSPMKVFHSTLRGRNKLTSLLDMFRTLLSSKLDKEDIFSCLVSKTGKPSLAYYRTPEPTDLVDAISALSCL